MKCRLVKHCKTKMDSSNFRGKNTHNDSITVLMKVK